MILPDIAQICHDANTSLCHAIGEPASYWERAPAWQQESALRGVAYALDHPDATPEFQHNAWLADKVMDGWTYGPVKDATAKTHPCMVPYPQLPPAQQAKDHLFLAIVQALRPFIAPEKEPTP